MPSNPMLAGVGSGGWARASCAGRSALPEYAKSLGVDRTIPAPGCARRSHPVSTALFPLGLVELGNETDGSVGGRAFVPLGDGPLAADAIPCRPALSSRPAVEDELAARYSGQHVKVVEHGGVVAVPFMDFLARALVGRGCCGWTLGRIARRRRRWRRLGQRGGGWGGGNAHGSAREPRR